MENTKCKAAIKLVDTIKRWKLFNQKDRVLVAVSGGIDSVVLLDLLIHLPKPLRPEIHVAHFNHKLRGRASDQDASFVEKLARQCGLAYHGGVAPVWRNRSNLEARARELRYSFLREVAIRSGIKIILTAHHADDQAETFIIRWVQGAGLRGLSGMALVRRIHKDEDLRLIRPLLLISRDWILKYQKENHVPFRQDASNRDLKFTRNRVRRWLM